MTRFKTYFGDIPTNSCISFVTIIVGLAVLHAYSSISNGILCWIICLTSFVALGLVIGFRSIEYFLQCKLKAYRETLPTHKILIEFGWKYLVWSVPCLRVFSRKIFEIQHEIILSEYSKRPTCFGDIATFFYIVLSFVTMIIGVTVLQALPSSSNVQLFMNTFVACFFAVGIAIGFRSFVNFLHRKLSTSTETLLTHKILIGCGGAYLIAAVPCIGVFFWDAEDTGKTWYILTVFPLFAAFFYGLFAQEHHHLYRFNWIPQFPRIFEAFISTTTISFLCFLGCTWSSLSTYKLFMVTLCHLVFLPMQWLCFTEFWLVMKGEIIWKLSKEDLDASCFRSVGERNYFLECGICFQTYNTTTKIPRILKECGHSVCEICSKQMETKHKFKRAVICPFCKIVTPIKVRAPEPLPKNYAVLGLLEEMEKFQNLRHSKRAIKF